MEEEAAEKEEDMQEQLQAEGNPAIGATFQVLKCSRRIRVSLVVCLCICSYDVLRDNCITQHTSAIGYIDYCN